MSTTAKALVITWLIIGFLVVGSVGFYVGRITTPKQELPGFNQNQQLPSQQGQGQMNQPTQGTQQGESYQQQQQQQLPQPSGIMQQPQGGTMQQPGGQQQGQFQPR